MKKIAILSAVNIKHMSLISLYTEKLIKDKITFDIIYMDKYGEEEEFSGNEKYVFKNIINSKDTKLKKIIKYFRFKKFAINIIEKNNYDFIIVWNDIAIFMFATYLAKYWKGKYCLNVRDYCGQKNPFIFKRFKHVISNSAFTTISSDGYRSFLPSYNYLQVHSLNKEILSKIKPRELFQKDIPIRISFVGNIRFMDINKKILDVFKNDKRFKVQFYGTNANILKKYAQENDIKNTDFHDSFQIAQTSQFIQNTDLVNNLYGNENVGLDYALSIKLYHGIYYRTPILVFAKTHMEKIISKYNIGYVVSDIDIDLPNRIYNWYQSLDFIKFNESCEKLLNEIEENNLEFENYYRRYIAPEF
ncbi:capsular biosynthesis protein [Fictibacillus aquaticus]|uniref:Capsular biosynthesis protein n=1 Tax=Fictibacillus aquaticus TaxID=2021314 RepID=A0A235F8L7_9BACL|nr:hypothetical protein [Fictibacillus aquaticus]OYD57608.1 hypothetical protein CGZ90_13150 [Fictibacillus aquaticus]